MPYYTSPVPVYTPVEIPGNDPDHWPVSLLTGPGDHGEPLLAPLGLEGHRFFFAWGPQACSLCSERTQLAVEVIPFLHLRKMSVRWLSRPGAQPHMESRWAWGPTAGVSPEDSWTEKSVGERFVSPLNKGGGSLLKRVVTLPVVWGSDRVCEPFSWPQWEGAVCCLVQLTCCSASWSGGTWPVMPWRYHLGLVLLHPLGAYPCCSGIHVNKKRGSNISVKRLKWIRGFWVAVVLGGSVSLSDPRSYQLFYL